MYRASCRRARSWREQLELGGAMRGTSWRGGQTKVRGRVKVAASEWFRLRQADASEEGLRRSGFSKLFQKGNGSKGLFDDKERAIRISGQGEKIREVVEVKDS